MESKRMAMLVVVMMLVMGNMLIETEAIDFPICYGGCVTGCTASASGVSKALCPFTCLKECIHPKLLSTEPDLEEVNDICKLGCATQRCVSISSVEDKDHVERVSRCVDSCSDTCSSFKN